MDGSFAVVFSKNNTKVLLVKRRDIPIWVLPGGGIERDETPGQAVIREVFEETGYVTKVVRKVGEYFYPQKCETKYIYECSIKGGAKTLSEESKAIEEFEINHLPDMMPPHTPIFIHDAVRGEKKVVKKEMHGYGFSFWVKGLFHPWAAFKYLLTRVGIHWNT